MTKFEKVKYYYDNKLWTLSRVRDAVLKGWITEQEFERITAPPYAEEQED